VPSKQRNRLYIKYLMLGQARTYGRFLKFLIRYDGFRGVQRNGTTDAAPRPDHVGRVQRLEVRAGIPRRLLLAFHVPVAGSAEVPRGVK